MIAHLETPGRIPDRNLAIEVRDLAAQQLLADPSAAYRLAGLLLDLVERRGDAVDPETKAIAWRGYAEGCLFTGRLKDARGAYERATVEAKESGNAALLGQILVGQIGTMTLMGETRETARLARRAEGLLRRAKDLPYLAKLHMNLGSAHYHAERYRDAEIEYGKAALAFEKAGNRDATWVGLRLNQGTASTHLHKIDEARRLFLEVESHAQRLGLERLGAQARYNRSSVEALRGDFRSSLSLLESAETIFEAQGVLDMKAACLLARAEIYLDLAMPGEGLGLARAAEEIFGAEQMRLDRMLACIAEASSLRLLHRPEEAATLLEEALSFYRIKRIRPRRAMILLHIARIHLDMGKTRGAARLAGRSLATFQRLGMKDAAARARCVLAEADLAEDRPLRAEAALLGAIRGSRSLATGTRFEIWSLSGRIARARGSRGTSLTRLRRAAELLENQRRLVPGVEFRSRLFESQVQVYRDLIAILIEAKRPDAANVFRIIESARGRGFRERLREGGRARSQEIGRGVGPARPAKRREPGRGTPDEIIRKRALLGSRIRRLERLEYGEIAPESADEPDLLRKEIASLEGSITSDVRRLESRSPVVPDWEGGIDPRSVAAHLEEGETLVEYFVGGGTCLAVVVRREGLRLRILPGGSDRARELAASLRFQIDIMEATAERLAGSLDFHRRAAEADLKGLYDILLRPLEDLLPARGRLILVPHSFLHTVPFETLHDGADYIDARWEIARCPTADFLLGRTRRARRRDGAVVIAGMIEGGPAFVPGEIEGVASTFRKQSRPRVRILRDPSPTEFLDAIEEARIVHVSTHGIFREDNPAFSTLSFHEGPVFLADILERRIAADLVVLAACNSGRVFAGQGDDLSGVAHGFLAAGTRMLVAGLWRVHDEATGHWMGAFYERLVGEGQEDPVDAMRHAGRVVREKWNHPFYWGGFCVQGV